MRKNLVLLACFAASASASATGSVTVDIHHLWEGKPLQLPSGDLTTASGEKIDLTRLAYLFSQPRLRQGDNTTESSGSWFQAPDLFIHVEAGGDVSVVSIPEIPAARYTTLEFCIGPDEETSRTTPGNFAAEHPLNPLRHRLPAPPRGGSIFLTLQGHLRGHDGIGGFAYHLGNPWNRITVTIPAAFELNHHATVVLDFHVDHLFNRAPALVIAERNTTHSRRDDPIAATLKERVEGAFTLREIRLVKEHGPPDVAPQGSRKTIGTPYPFHIPEGFPNPDLPADNPLTKEGIRLGQSLFYEMQLSRSNTQACASCHNPTYALADRKALSIGDNGQEGARNTMPLFNLAWKDSFFWDGRAPSLRDQALRPIENPVEMHESLDHVIEELTTSGYPPRFEAAFGTGAITPERIGLALEQYLLTQTSYNSRFDRATKGRETFSDQEQQGFELFMTEHDPARGLRGAGCFHCHGGPLFTDLRFHNNGLKDENDLGLERVTGNLADRHHFATPSLRNIALTAPYMHDGRFATLEEVVAHYDSGLHRSPTLDPNLAKHPSGGLDLTTEDKAALVAFLKTLTDPKFKD